MYTYHIMFDMQTAVCVDMHMCKNVYVYLTNKR